MIKKLKMKKAREIAKSYRVHEILTRFDNKKFSFVFCKARRHKETCLNTKSARAYYILKGKIKVEQGKTKLTAKRGESIFIPANTKYTFSGTFDAIQIMSPPFNPKYDKSWL